MADQTNPFVGFLRKAFPFISVAASLGGPAGTMAANMLGKAIGQDVKSDASSIANALTVASANPDQLLAAQKAEQDFQLQMAKLGFQDAETLEATASADRANARDREIKTGDKWTPRCLAWLVVIAWGIVQFYILPHAMTSNHTPDASMIGILNRVLGTLDGALMLVLAYYFGSSAGSDRKNEILADQQK